LWNRPAERRRILPHGGSHPFTEPGGRTSPTAEDAADWSERFHPVVNRLSGAQLSTCCLRRRETRFRPGARYLSQGRCRGVRGPPHFWENEEPPKTDLAPTWARHRSADLDAPQMIIPPSEPRPTCEWSRLSRLRRERRRSTRVIAGNMLYEQVVSRWTRARHRGARKRDKHGSLPCGISIHQPQTDLWPLEDAASGSGGAA